MKFWISQKPFPQIHPEICKDKSFLPFLFPWIMKDWQSHCLCRDDGIICAPVIFGTICITFWTMYFYKICKANLRHCNTSRKVSGSIPDGVTGIFLWHNPSDRTMSLGLNQVSNRNEYQEYFLGGKGGRCEGLTTLPPSCADCLAIWEPQSPGTLTACPGL